jgi:hypothetical protein
LYFYRRVISLREQSDNVAAFLACDYNIESLYATLVAWGMNSRRAEMEDFDNFKKSLVSCRGEFEAIENFVPRFDPGAAESLIPTLREAYNKLTLMKTKSRLVSNSKCLHFLFPSICMPMDGRNTLQYFYGNTGESTAKYIEIMSLAFEIMRRPVDLRQYIDDKKWNASIPKMIDNAIFLLQEKARGK